MLGCSQEGFQNTPYRLLELETFTRYEHLVCYVVTQQTQ